jgi:hypothetical protein
MMRAILPLAAMLALANCSRPNHMTRVVNRSSEPVTVTYVDAREGVTRTVAVAAGETGSLPPNRTFADLSDLRLSADDRDYVWADWTSMRGRLGCSGDCVVTWFPGHRLDLSGPYAMPSRGRSVGPPPLFNPSSSPARGQPAPTRVSLSKQSERGQEKS